MQLSLNGTGICGGMGENPGPKIRDLGHPGDLLRLGLGEYPRSENPDRGHPILTYERIAAPDW